MAALGAGLLGLPVCTGVSPHGSMDRPRGFPGVHGVAAGESAALGKSDRNRLESYHLSVN
jgi:hypothetical protein